MRDSQRYAAQAEFVLRLAARAEGAAEREVFLRIADGWKKLAAEAARNERQRESNRPAEPRSFRADDD
jgi:hypothetical protein